MTSLWNATNPLAAPRRPALSVHTPDHGRSATAECDVAIVGGGFTGLWTARSLLVADPSLDVLVIDAERCGFGASGRNGGWCSALFPTSHAALTSRFGAAAADAQREAMRAAVDEVGRAAAEDDIDCHFAKGGTITMATGPAQIERVRDHLEDGDEWLDASAARELVAAEGLLGAAYTPHCAALHPARLASGLAAAVERRRGRIVEATRVRSIEPGLLTCADGATVRADTIIRATEGFTPSIEGLRRAVVPIYSLMIATEPLPDHMWASIGLARRETFTDGRHMIIYGQRTADGRLAFGGRGAPYHLGSRVKPSYDLDGRVFGLLETTLRSLFPQIGGAAITHRWGGPLGVPRDWMASVGFDPTTRVGWAGGYVGDGVSTTNLAGRTLADLVLGRTSPLTELPWVGHRSPDWEPEPLRWLGINGGRAVADVADRVESRTGKPARWAETVMSKLSGG
ncbi:MAG: FAD-binding oxidoreductase [Acidimicrobiales bacterium]